MFVLPVKFQMIKQVKFFESLNSSNVTTKVSKIDDSTSGECLVLITPDNERTMNTYLGSQVYYVKKIYLKA